jgi:hypothetical protein
MKSFGLLLLLSASQVFAKLGESHVQQQEESAGQRGLMALQFHGSNPNFKLGRCEGDCDSDSDWCVTRLVFLFIPSSSAYSSYPSSLFPQ